MQAEGAGPGNARQRVARQHGATGAVGHQVEDGGHAVDLQRHPGLQAGGGQLVFDVHDGLVVDPTEERLRDEFAGTKVLHLPMQSIVRIEEVERKGQSAIRDAESGERVVTPFPLPAKPR